MAFRSNTIISYNLNGIEYWNKPIKDLYNALDNTNFFYKNNNKKVSIWDGKHKKWSLLHSLHTINTDNKTWCILKFQDSSQITCTLGQLFNTVKGQVVQASEMDGDDLFIYDKDGSVIKCDSVLRNVLKQENEDKFDEENGFVIEIDKGDYIEINNHFEILDSEILEEDEQNIEEEEEIILTADTPINSEAKQVEKSEEYIAAEKKFEEELKSRQTA